MDEHKRPRRDARAKKNPVVAGMSAALLLLATANAGATAVDAPSADVQAGRYLADAAHCDACHTSRPDQPFAGNVPIVSKFGTMYSSNITPDPKTGIGQWTEAEFTSALRLGKGRHGEYLYPSMPYTDFTKISDADVHSLWLYFRSIRPIVEKQKPNAMSFPFDVRPGIAAWQAVYFRPGRYVPDTSQSSEWNRGAYLVEGLGHCGACHTPKNFAMADKTQQALQGAATGDNWFAPNISGSRFSGIRDWSEAQIVNYLKTGHNDKNVAAVGPMLETIAEGTQKLAPADLQAIAVYLKNQAPEKTAAHELASALSPERKAAGAAVYAANCAACHGSDGKGVDGIAPALAGNSAVSAAGPQNTIHAMLAGFVPNGRWGAMPSFAQALDSQQITDVANYVRTAWGAQVASNATVSGVNTMRDAVDSEDPRIVGALTCPEVQESEVDPKTTAEVQTLAKAPGDPAVPARLVRDYNARHPGGDKSRAVNVLAGLYCRSLMANGSGSVIDRQTRVIRFTARVAAESTASR
jgi:mono/diheme cytochrome c family protein